MLCPVCTTDMIIQELNDVEVDHCLDCHGIWFDHGELEMLLGDDGGDDPLVSAFRIAVTDEKARRCPICKTYMQKVHSGDVAHQVLIDRCPKDHGIWFDAGELNQVLDASATHSGSKLAALLKEMFPGRNG